MGHEGVEGAKEATQESGLGAARYKEWVLVCNQLREILEGIWWETSPREEKVGFTPLEIAHSCVRKMLMCQEFWNLF